MAMGEHTAEDLRGRSIYTSDGQKLGKVDEVLTDDTGAPQYLEVKTGMFGARRHAIPVQGLSESGDDLTLSYTMDQLQVAPTFEEHEQVDYDREVLLGRHYGHQVRDWDDTRDNWLAGEDLSRGPTPETRHPGGIGDDTGGLDDVRDTTQGPTPETRQTMRATKADPSAAMEPGADRRTRGDVGGNQDLDALDAPRRVGYDPDADADRDLGSRAVDDPALTGYDAPTYDEGAGADGEYGQAGRTRLRRWNIG